MSLVSLSFFIEVIISVGIYYICPKKYQVYSLLLFSLLFFIYSSPLGILYLLSSVFAVWLASYKISCSKNKKIWLIVGLGVPLIILFILKYLNFFTFNINRLFSSSIPALELLAPIGLSYYTLELVGYLLDVYWGKITYEKSFLRFLVFASYFPKLTSGPITRYDEVSKELFAGHEFDWNRVTFGLQRILWGIFKKLVLAIRAESVVNTIYSSSEYCGFYIWIAAFMFMLQLYFDFSGLMDIVLGVSECYGIYLPENFNKPFLSQTLQEYWQRWHITLGAFLRDYILYPILKTSLWYNMGKVLKKKFSKKASKKIPSYLGMLVVWLLIGLWHGGKWKFVLGMGLFNFVIIVIEDLLDVKSKVNKSSKFVRVLRSIKVFIFVSVGNMFFRLPGLITTLKTIKRGFVFNPSIFIDGSLLKTGLNLSNWIVLLVGIIIVILTYVIGGQKGFRNYLKSINIVPRWIILLLLIWVIMVFGIYGPGYDASSFIYEKF